MALSNWAVAIYDADGKPRHNKVKCGFVEIEIYKSSIYFVVDGTRIGFDGDEESSSVHFSRVRKPEELLVHGVEPDRRFIHVDIMRIDEPSGIMFMAYEYGGKQLNEHGRYDHYRTILGTGLGCYGFSGEDWVGIPNSLYRKFVDWITDSNRNEEPTHPEYIHFRDYVSRLARSDKNLSSCILGFHLDVDVGRKDLVAVVDCPTFFEDGLDDVHGERRLERYADLTWA